MYAAAGGASLASRQARQRQRQTRLQQVKSQQKDLKPPAAKQYHNYTDDAIVVPKLSRVERGTLRPPQQHQAHQPAPNERRHSASHYHLKEPPKNRLRESPSICIPVQRPHHHPHPPAPFLAENHVASSPTLPQILIPEGDEKGLERRCSFVRQVEEQEKTGEGGGLLDRCNHLCNFEIKDVKAWGAEGTSSHWDIEREIFGSLDYPFSEGRAAWQERERGRRCSLSEEARQHRIKQTEAHHRWMKRNRIHDSTYGGGSDDEDFFSVYHQSAAANALLYVGLGTTAIGSVIFFVGTGEKGFKTLELRLIGPTLIACGLLCCLIRVLLCACPSTCLRRRKKSRLKDSCPHSSSRYPLAERNRQHHDFHSDSSAALLAHKHKKKVSIVPPNYPVPGTSTNMADSKEPLQPQPWQPSPPNQKPPSATTIPQINLPQADSIIELQSLDLAYDDDDDVVQSASISEDSDDDDDQSVTVIETVTHQSKLARTRGPANQVRPIRCDDDDVETCLSVIVESGSGKREKRNDASGGGKSENKQTHSGIVLSPLQLGQ